MAMVVMFLSTNLTGEEARTRPAFKPVPPGVVELTGVKSDGGIVELHDGTLMLAQGGGINDQSAEAPAYRISQDRGRTWSTPQPLNSPIGVGGLIRLQSGALAIYGRKFAKGSSPWEYYFSASTDEGKTWKSPALIANYPDYYPMYHSLIQLRSGRLLLVGYWYGQGGGKGGAERMSSTAMGWGLWEGKILWLDGHRGVEMGMCMTYYSDDQGKTWKRSEESVFGWFDERGEHNGLGGIVDLYEPTMAETKDGGVLLLARSKTGRLVQSYSLDGGASWNSAEPTELASSQSPAMLIQLPKTGDLLCVWNQASGEEIRRGFFRGRLSVALSGDNGLTWEHFKTLELQPGGMEDVTRIAPEFPIARVVRPRSPYGRVIADGVAIFAYPNMDIVGDKVFLRYARDWPWVIPGKPKRDPNLPVTSPKYEDREAQFKGEPVLRIYPLNWFYTE